MRIDSIGCSELFGEDKQRVIDEHVAWVAAGRPSLVLEGLETAPIAIWAKHNERMIAAQRQIAKAPNRYKQKLREMHALPGRPAFGAVGRR